MFKRGYLNKSEENFYLVAKSFIQMIEGTRSFDNKVTEEVWTEWGKRGMLTPIMKKSIKMVHTYLRKFVYEIETNLNKETTEKLRKKSYKFDFRIIDDYSLKKIYRDISNKHEFVTMKREYFLGMLEIIAEVKCVGCNEDYRKCELCKALDDINIGHVGEKDNCPYAADLVDYNEEQQEQIKLVKKKLKEKNKFYKGL